MPASLPLRSYYQSSCRIQENISMAGISQSRLHRDLNRVGFHLFDGSEDLPLEPLAFSLGQPIPSLPQRPNVDVLVPKTREDSPPGTLSSMHGVNAFPFHTETAHWRHPVDLIILKCVNPGAGNRRTLMIDGYGLNIDDKEINQLTHSLMVVRNGSNSFLASLASRGCNRLLFRYDPSCMKPASHSDYSALKLLEHSLVTATRTEITWKAGQCLILDNRRIFHSRASSSIDDSDRRLERIYVVTRES